MSAERKTKCTIWYSCLPASKFQPPTRPFMCKIEWLSCSISNESQAEL